MYVLGIESTCDETAAAIVEDGRKVISNVISTSVKEQALYGGVVPEIASRRHAEYISATVDKALADAGMTMADVDAVAVTFAPGLIGAVLVGVNFAKGLAYAAGKPLVPVHHLRGHIAANYLTHQDLKPPFLCLVASGGHSHIVLVEDWCRYKILGRTVDDAAGEAFDKCAKVMGLPYPGGPVIDRLAKEGDPKAFRFAHPRVEGYDYSFSGLKTSFLYTLRDAVAADPDFIETHKADLCASLQGTIVEILLDKLIRASKETGIRDIAIAGGVSANSGLRDGIAEAGRRRGWRTFLPEFKFTTDNAAMIALAGYYRYMNGNIATLDIAPVARLEELELTVAPTAEQ
jgi:N6-L-threonylcarbamoyladenine synthase